MYDDGGMVLNIAFHVAAGMFGNHSET